MKFQLLLISTFLFCNCCAIKVSLNPITNIKNAVNTTRNTINDATEYGRNLKDYGKQTIHDVASVRSISDAANLGYKLATEPIQKPKERTEEEFDVAPTLPSLFGKRSPILDAKKRNKMIMHDCITETLTDVDPAQLENFIDVNDGLAALIQAAFDASRAAAEETPAEGAPETNTSTSPDNAQPEEIEQPKTIDYTAINKLMGAFDAMKYFANIIPKTYDISSKTVQKFTDAN